MPPCDSIIILAYNKADYTRACLESLLATRPVCFEAIVVDNGSTDATPLVIEEMGPRFAAAGSRLRALRNGSNVGAVVGRNQAMACAEGEYFVFLDNDTLVCDPAWIEKLRQALDSTRAAALVGPKICFPFAPHPIQCAGVGISRTGRVQFRGRGEPRDDPRFNRREETQALISACFMFPRRLYEEIGGLDEAFSPVQFEDFDFCYRARSRGYRAIYAPEAEILHWESVTSDGSPALPNTYLIIRNGMEFKRRWRRMFEAEDGPPDEACRWRVIETPGLDGMSRRVGGAK
jgi:GT2 family glycosyltransferase